MPLAAGADDYTTWSYSQKILLNTSSTGANVSQNVHNVPVLIRLNPGNFKFFTQTLAGGADMRFAKTSGAHLPYQIERWIDRTGNNDTAEIWVKIDTVFGNNFTQSIVMYWGNTAAVDSQSGASVFSPATGAMGAWHLGGSLADATGNGYNGVDNGTVDTAGGLIGRARSFNGTSQFFNVGDLPDRPSGTISCWFRPKATFNPSATVSQGIWGKKGDDGNNATLTLRGTDFTPVGSNITGKLVTKMESSNSGLYLSTVRDTFAAATWYHVSWSWGNGTDSIYINGVIDSSKYSSQTIAAAANDEIGRSLYDAAANIPSGGPLYFNGTIDEFRIDNTIRSADWVRLNFENQKSSQTLVTSGGDVFWDTGTASGYQRGSGIWGTNKFWSRSGTQLIGWPGRGYTAFFDEIGSSATIAHTVTVSGTQYLDSLVVRDNTYTFTGGTLDFGSRSGIYIPTGITTNINSVIAGSGGLSKYGTGTLVLAGSNSYTGVTTLSSGRLRISSLADGGTACAIGASTGIASNLVLNGGGLEYTGGPNTSTNRLFTISTVQCSLNVSSANVNFTNTGAIAFSGSGARTFCLGGNGTGTFVPTLGNNGGATSLRKYGSGTWILNGKNTYSGATTVSTGTFLVNGSLDSTSGVTIAAGATIGGSGTIAGSVNATATGATILPGNAGPGKFRTGALTLSSASIINLDLGTTSDTIAVTGNLTLNGTVNIAPAAGFGPGTYRICTYTGTLTNDTLTAGTAPTGRKCSFEYGAGYVNAVITVRLLQTEPADTSLLAGQSAVFTASAIGTGTLSYAWQQYPAVAVGTGTSTLTIASVTGAMNGSRYRCIVSDSLLASDTSRWATMTVLSAPQITTQPHDTTITLGDAAKFSVLVADTSRCTYAWLKTGYPTVLGTTATYSIATAAATDEGDYYCIITNPAASVHTDTVHLTVRPLPPEAKFGCSPQTGIVPLEVTFTDSSTGVISSRRWEFGDGTTDTAAHPKHTFSVVGRFGVVLIVTGAGGTDITDTVYVTVNHPAPVARFTFSPEAGLVPLEVSFTDASTGPLTSRKWYFGDGSGDTAANPKHTYTISGLYTVALAVTGPGGFDSLVKKDSVSVLEKGQNPLRMSARFISGDQVAITINRVDLVDTKAPVPWCDSIGVWLTFGSLPQTPASAKLSFVYRRASFKGDSIVDTLRLSSSESVVGLMTGLFWNDATVSEFKAENGCLVVLEKGQNPLRLRAQHIAGMDIGVTIDRLDLLDTVAPVPWCDSIGIWFAPGALPQSPDKSTLAAVYRRAQFRGEALSDTLTLSLPDSLIGLMAGIFWNNGTVSEFLVANGSIVSIKEEERDTSLVVRITRLDYDSMTAALRVSWCIDSAFFPGELDVGIAWSLDSVPKSMAGTQVVTAFSACTDTVVSFGGPLQFDTLYHVALFVRRTVRDGWSAFNALSYDTVRTGHPFRQVISFFDNRVARDTVRAFNGKFFLRKDSTYTTSSPIIDTLEVYRFAPPAGFAMAGLPVRFVGPGPVLPLFVGISIDSLPGSARARDVRMYRDSAGMLLACFGTATDSVHRVVSVRTDDLRLPFIAMVDTTPPVVVFVNKSDSIAYVDRDIVDSIRISDNIANVRWSYLYGKGEDAPTVRDGAELRDTAVVRRIIVSKESQSISSESGLRAWLIVDDAVHRDTIDLSRPVHRDSSDKATTIDNSWYPIYATARLAATGSVPSLIAGVNANSDSYDRRYVRLFRWIETDANRGNDSSKWVEYDQDNSSIQALFVLDPGRLFWLKTRGNMQFDFGAARTLSLKDTFRIDLPAGQFTDFGMPFRFGVRIGDVLRASGGYADSIRFYRWTFDSTGGRYALEPLYVATMSDKNDPKTLLEFGQHSGYCLYNPYDTVVTLSIPPIPVAMSAPSGSGKKGSDRSWCAKLIANCSGEGRLPQVYFGYVPKLAKSEYPVMPSFGNVRISLFERVGAKNSGHYIAGDAEGGLVKELRISNSSDSTRQVTFRMETAGKFPENFTALLFDAASGTFTSEGAISVAPHSAVSRWCSIGDAAWHKSFSASAAQFAYGLRRIYPNPARSLVKIGYTVPLGAQELIRIDIFDLRGRRIWEKRVDGLPVAGHHLVTWNGRDDHRNSVGAGMYLIRLSVVGIGGKVLRRFEQPITYLP